MSIKNKQFFIITFFIVLFIPLLCINRVSDLILKDENRKSAELPHILTDEGGFNNDFSIEYEEWINDNIGMRNLSIKTNAIIQYYVFNNTATSDWYIGNYGDINYATDEMLRDYQHLNLRTNEEISRITKSYQDIADYLDEHKIQFYYLQCYDKHSIYPEQFMSSVYQYGDISKTQQLMSALTQTNVNVISVREDLLQYKKEEKVYSNWGDPSHWNQKGAYVGYLSLMNCINAHNNDGYRVLGLDDYNIYNEDEGCYLNKVIHHVDIEEQMDIKEPNAVRIPDIHAMKEFSEDERHKIYTNESVDNSTHVLILGDSYLDSFILDDLAESFSETWLIWGDYFPQLKEILSIYNPDIIIFECAERCDRSNAVMECAETLE